MDTARRLRLMLLSLPLFLAAAAAVNWLVNPYGAWRTSFIDGIYRSSQLDNHDAAKREAGERVTIAYRLRVEQPTTLLVGSSRIVQGMPIERGYRDGVFNAGLRGATLVEIAAVLRLAMTNPRLQRVIFGVDFHAFDEKFHGFRYPETRVRLEADDRLMTILRIKDTLFSTQALDDSWSVLLRAIAGRKYMPPPFPVPWPESVIKPSLEDSRQNGLDDTDEATVKQQLDAWVVHYSNFQLSGALLSVFEQTVARAREAGIDVVLFVTPLSTCELEIIRQMGHWDTFQHWKRQLLRAAGAYWDFSGYNELERAAYLFMDAQHFKPAVGHVILRQLLGEDCPNCGDIAGLIRDAGVWVDAATVEQHLARQEANRMARALHRSRCTKIVEDLLGSR